MSNIAAMDRIVHDFGKDGLRFFFLFKILKSQVKDELKKQHLRLPNDAILNKVCAETANELLIADKGQPTEDAINEIALKLRK